MRVHGSAEGCAHKLAMPSAQPEQPSMDAPPPPVPDAFTLLQPSLYSDS